MNKPYYTVRVVLRRSDIGHAIQSHTILKTASPYVPDHIMDQFLGDHPNWNVPEEIAHAWESFSEDDQAILREEGFGP